MALNTALTVSDREIDVFAARYPNDARPIQPVKRSRSDIGR